MLLIIDNNENIKTYFTCETEFLDTGNFSLVEALEKIRQYKNVKKIYFPLELKFENKYRQHFEGLELLKHIRLTPELGSLQYAPILLGYTYPLETILRNPESTILCAPATYLFHLKNIQLINNSKFFQSTNELNKEKLKPYILYTDTDTDKSEHDRRNESGPLKLEKELKGIQNRDIDLDLWQKKILFLQPEARVNEPTTNISDKKFKNAIKGKRILCLDDEADKWEKQLKQLFDGANITTIKNFSEIQNLCDNIAKKKFSILEEYRKKDAEITELIPTIEGLQSRLKNKQSELRRFRNELNAKQKEIESLKSRTSTIHEEAQQLLKEHYESMAEFLIDDHDKIENMNDVVMQNFIQVSSKLKLVKDSRDSLQKASTNKLGIEKKIQEIKKEINSIQNDLIEKKNIDLKFHAKYVSELSAILEYDLIILDLRLNPNTDRNNPTPSGIKVLDSVKQFNPHIPVLLFTSSQNPQILESAKKLNMDAYWVKNVSHVNDLKRNVLNILLDTKVYDIYWKLQLISNKTNIEKYFVSDYGKTVEKRTLSQEDKKVLTDSLNYFIHFIKSKSPSVNDFWTNTGKLSEARFVSAKNKQGHPERDRPQLIDKLNLGGDEKDFNTKRNKLGAHIGGINDDFDFCKKYIDHSIDWFLNYLYYKE